MEKRENEEEEEDNTRRFHFLNWVNEHTADGQMLDKTLSTRPFALKCSRTVLYTSALCVMHRRIFINALIITDFSIGMRVASVNEPEHTQQRNKTKAKLKLMMHQRRLTFSLIISSTRRRHRHRRRSLLI